MTTMQDIYHVTQSSMGSHLLLVMCTVNPLRQEWRHGHILLRAMLTMAPEIHLASPSSISISEEFEGYTCLNNFKMVSEIRKRQASIIPTTEQEVAGDMKLRVVYHSKYQHILLIAEEGRPCKIYIVSRSQRHEGINRHFCFTPGTSRNSGSVVIYHRLSSCLSASEM